MVTKNSYELLHDELNFNKLVHDDKCSDNVKCFSRISHEFNNSMKSKNNRHRRGGGKRKRQISSVSDFKIAFNNVNGFKSKEYEITRFLNDEDICVFSLAETFFKGSQGININGYTWVGKNRTRKQRGGIGVLVSNKVDIINDNVFDSRCDEMERMWVKLKFVNVSKPIYIATAYFPVEGADPNLTNEMYTQLLSEVIKIENLDEDGEPQILLCGDLNARIGNAIPFGDPIKNNNGERLLTFNNDANMSIINCTKMCFGKITWMRNCQSSTIDYFLGSNALMNRVNKMTVDEEGSHHMGSDHNMLILNLKQDTGYKTASKEVANNKRFVWNIKHNQDWTVYQKEIDKQFCNWDTTSYDDVNDIWDTWKSKVLKTANQTIGTKEVKGNNNKPWVDSEIRNAVNKRKNANREHRNWVKSNSNDKTKGEALWNTYKEKKSAAKSLIRKKIMQKRVDKSIKIASKGGPGCKDFWKNLRGDTNKRDRLNTLKIPNSNSITTDRTVMKQSIMQYFHTLGKMHRNLYNHNDTLDERVSRPSLIKSISDLAKASLTDDHKDEHLSDLSFSLDDVISATRVCKNNKAPGIDCITNELIKNGGPSMFRSLYDMFTFFRNNERIPDEWNKGIIIPIHKKGAKNDLNNYRGITLNSCVSKIYNRLLSVSISSFLEVNNLLGEIQGGFRSNHRCEDHIFTLKSITACRLAEGKQTHLAFLDFKKAFDTVWREGLLNAAWGIGLRGRMWRILSNLYNKVQGQVQFGSLLTDFFDIDEGVKQGCVLSPILFCIFINELSKMIKEAKLGVRVCNVQIGCLFWADDVVLISEDGFELQKMLNIAASFADQWRLQFNYGKSNVLVTGRRNPGKKLWSLGDGFISEVNQYKYLGIQISSNLSDHGHIEEVVRKGHRLIAYIKSIIDDHDDYNRVYYGDILWKSIGLPSINYACSVWVPSSNSDIKKLENLQVQMAKTILKAPRNMTMEALYGDLGWNRLCAIQDNMRIDYLERLFNLDVDRWPKLLFNASFHVTKEKGCLQWKWFKHVQDCLSRCGLDHIFINRPPLNNGWSRVFKDIHRQIEVDEWRKEAQSKSSLGLYLSLKTTPGRENYLMDNANFSAAILKLRARTNTLQLERYTQSWSPTNNGLCNLCRNNYTIEDIAHFMFHCPSLNNIRIKKYRALEINLLNNNFDTLWELFMAGDDNLKLFMMLGNLYEFNIKLGEIFDSSSKNILLHLWEERKMILNS